MTIAPAVIAVQQEQNRIVVDGKTYEVVPDQKNNGEMSYTIEGFPEIAARIDYDEVPRDDLGLDYDRIGTMVVQWNRYLLGDSQEIPDTTVECDVCGGTGETPDERYEIWKCKRDDWMRQDRIKVASGTSSAMGFVRRNLEVLNPHYSYLCLAKKCETCDGDGDVELTIPAYLKREEGATVVLPLYVMEHGAISISTGGYGCPWDSGMAGFIYDTPHSRKNIGVDDPEKIAEMMEQEVDTYDSVIQGDVYVVKIDDGHDDEVVGGFIGIKHAEEELFASLGYSIAQVEHERAEETYWRDRGVVTV